MSEKPETKLQRQIVEELKLNYGQNIWILKTHGSGYQKRGVPDLLICLYGRFIAIEVKMPGKEPTENQRAVMWEMQKAGVYTACVTTVSHAVNVCDRVLKSIKQDIW